MLEKHKMQKGELKGVKLLKLSASIHLVCISRVVAEVDLQCADFTYTCGRERVETLRGIHSSPGGLHT